VWLENCRNVSIFQGTSPVWWDHVVVAKKYIGPPDADGAFTMAARV
jgi:hypothetical protein